jgi:2-polyprenyl-3-methyl-5-hydroxy-6-metoxy-1,4-benzoquinol methylase
MRLVRKLKTLVGARGPRFVPYDKPVDWQKPYETLRTKWIEVPITNEEILNTAELLALPDDELLAKWEKSRKEITTGAEWAHRGWYHTLYADSMRGKKVMDIGSGFGVDSITFAQHGARMTFVDLVETNLKVLQRICKILELKDVQFHHFQDLDSLRALDTDYDVIMAMGSLHNAPVEVMKPEYQELLRHLRVGGRWLQLAYPKSLWVKAGRPTFDKWGQMLERSPWEEWYDVPKLLSMFEPGKFEVVLYHEFHNGDFNWFDLLYKGQ